ncbi:MAG TPA: hypothetical protein VLZ83_16860 [Edaphocola sp.]|nr:hypothetical protein [Edaphocola sp.]
MKNIFLKYSILIALNLFIGNMTLYANNKEQINVLDLKVIETPFLSIQQNEKKLVAKFDASTHQIIELSVDTNALHSFLLENNIFSQVAKIEITIANENQKLAYFTLIGVDNNGMLTAYQCDLLIEGTNVFLPNPEFLETFGKTHTCNSGSECSSCDFNYNKYGQIIGCKCLSGSAVCGHTVSTTTKEHGAMFSWDLVYSNFLF